MALEVKKWHVVQLISSIENEEVLDEIRAKIIQLIPQSEINQSFAFPTTHMGFIEDKLDLEKVKAEQEFDGIDPQKMAKLANQADIRESLDELLNMLTP